MIRSIDTVIIHIGINGTKYSRVDQVKFVEKFEGIWSASRPYPFKFFKDYLPQTLLGPLLNALSRLIY